MEELHLVGVSDDARHAVLSDDPEGPGRFLLALDDDLRAALRKATTGGEDRPGPAVRRGVPNGEASPSRESKLSPRELQALLRAGSTPRAVAREAGADEAWVRRWLPPIEAERERVLQALSSATMTKTRLGPSNDPIGDAIARNLAAKGVDPEQDSVSWVVTRRENHSYWTVTLRYRNRGRPQRAVWRYYPDDGAVEPRNDLAVDIAWTRPGATEPDSRPAKKSAKKKTAKKKSTKKTTAKKAPGQRPAKKKAAGTAGKKTGTTAARRGRRRSGR